MKSAFWVVAFAFTTISFAEPVSNLDRLSPYVDSMAAKYFTTGVDGEWKKDVTIAAKTRYSSGNESILISPERDGVRTMSGSDTAKGVRWTVTQESGTIRSFSVCEKNKCLNASAGSCHALYNLVQKMGETDLEKSAKNCEAMATATNDNGAKEAVKGDKILMTTAWADIMGKSPNFPMLDANVTAALGQIPKLYEICKKVAFYPDVQTNGYSTYWKSDSIKDEASVKQVQ
jgi:hypothetical protein